MNQDPSCFLLTNQNNDKKLKKKKAHKKNYIYIDISVNKKWKEKKE